MAFVVQCPFCNLRARVPGRANGAVGRCPKCANSFTLAPADDQQFPESADEPDVEPTPASAVSAAIAEAAASVEAPRPADALPTQGPAPSGFQPAAAAGALALLLGGLALVCGSISALRGLVIPTSALGLLMGLAGVVLARLSARPRLLLPSAGSVAAGAVLIVGWVFPALLGPAYEYARQSPAPLPPPALRAIPLAGAPALTDAPAWVDASRYALERDGLRVQVVRVSLLPADAKAPPMPEGRLLVRVRVSLQRPDAKPLERQDNPAPTLTDDLSKPYALRQSEFFDQGGGKGKPGLFAVPTIEETFAFAAPAEGWKNLRLELPAARWQGSGVFQFTIGPLQKNK